jgi:hypothetical protein
MIKFNDSLPNGGVPFFANDFNFMQDMQMTLMNIMLEQYYSLLPQRSLILSGLTVGFLGSTTTISSISEGHVMLDGELYWFPKISGLSQTSLYIYPGTQTEEEYRTLENTLTGVIKVQKIATFSNTVPSSGPYIFFNPLPTVYLNDLMFRASKKIGEIIPLGLLNGNSPLLGTNGLSLFTTGTGNTAGTGLFSYSGFALCNGNNGTTNLKGRFLTGYDAQATAIPSNATNKELNYGAIGNTGGEFAHPLSISEMPDHTHRDRWLSAFGGPNSLGYGGQNGSLGNAFDSYPVTGHPGKTASHENRPPYYTAAFIQRIS